MRQKTLYILRSKGQIISKCLFDVFNFFQKTNENKSHSSKNEFVRSFFGRNQDTMICFRDYLTFSNHYFFFRINFNSLWSEWLERIKKNVSEHYYFSIHVAKTKSNCYVSGLHYINRYVKIVLH